MADKTFYVRDPQSGQMVPLSLTDNLDGTYSFSGGAGGGATAAQVWDEALSGHSTAGTAGKALTDILAGAISNGLAVQGVVTTATSTTQFSATALAGYGNDYFVGWEIYVLWDAAGAHGAPQAEHTPATDYVSTGGVFTHVALTQQLALTDKVLLVHPVIYSLLTLVTAIPTTATQDGVYFDEILGSAGTALPIGTATSPVNNLADALTIMTARKLKKLYLAGTGAHAITLTNGINIQIVGNAEYAVTIDAGATVTIGSDLLCKSFTNTTGTPTINGNLTSMTTISTTTGTITVWGNAYAGTTTTMSGAAGTLTVYGDAKLMGDVTTSNATAAITIGGNAFFGHDYQGTAGTLNINGNCQVVNTINIVASPGVSIKGKLDVSGDITITGAGSANISVIGNCTVLGNVTRPAGTLGTFTFGNLEVGQNVDVEGNASFTAYGNVIVHYVGWYSTGGTVLIVGDLVVRRGGIAASIGSLTVYGNIYAKNEFDTTTGSITVYGNAYVANGFCSATTGTITVWGNLYVGTTTTVSGAAGALVVHGNAVLIGAVGATNGTASITIDGFADIRGAITATGTITYRGVQPEVAVNISAISASETNFLDLEVASTHYTVSDLVLKCADPGADTVNVKIYKLVNAVLTSVVTFAITTVNYTSYFSLMDMLGQSILVGDKLKITVQATAGAGYAVTGSYSSRKD